MCIMNTHIQSHAPPIIPQQFFGNFLEIICEFYCRYLPKFSIILDNLFTINYHFHTIWLYHKHVNDSLVYY